MVKKIALEEHFLSPGFEDYWKTTSGEIAPDIYRQAVARLGEFGDLRLAQMDRGGIARAVLSIAGPGVQPYVQFPWSAELGRGWAITGMVTNFFTPANPATKYSNQSTFVIEREFGERSFLFVEYVGDFPLHGGTGQLINSGGGYRITETQQIDFHIGFGLNRNSPTYIFGVGYSFRLDGLFKSKE